VKKTAGLVSLGLALLIYCPAWADQMDFADKGVNSSPSFVGLLAKLILALVLIVGLIYASMYVLKKFSYTGKQRLRSDIQILQREYIAPKKGIYVVKVQSKTLVLGVTDNNINLLTELSEAPNRKDESANCCPDLSFKNKTVFGLMQKMKGRFDSLWQKRERDEV